MRKLYHITTGTDWEAAEKTGIYRADSLANDGFIHCSTLVQLLMPANAMYRGQEGLVLLVIDPSRVKPEVVYEDCYQSGHRFPHLYGPLNIDAVVSVLPFPPNPDGTFNIPSELGQQMDAADSLDPSLCPILEFDPAPEAIIEPKRIIPAIDIPEHAILCFFQDVINDLKAAGRLRQIHKLGSEIGINPVYELDVDGQRLAMIHAGLGAPLSACFLEELIALGSRKFIACGGGGVLDNGIDVGNIVVPSVAIRDEGTSYHYLPPSREVSASPEAVAAIEQVLTRHQIDYVVGKTWTTDGIYRETAAKMARRRAEGCLIVEMESAAFFAVAQFRQVIFGQILYGGDDLTGDEWDHRDWYKQGSTREKLFWLAAEACLTL